MTTKAIINMIKNKDCETFTILKLQITKNFLNELDKQTKAQLYQLLVELEELENGSEDKNIWKFIELTCDDFEDMNEEDQEEVFDEELSHRIDVTLTAIEDILEEN